MFKKIMTSVAIAATLTLGACGPSQTPPPPPPDVPVAPPPANTPAPEAAPAPRPRPRPEPRAEREPIEAPRPPACEDCGTIASIREERVTGQPTLLGTLGGAGAGAAAGGQFGKKSGKFAMMALGAVGGAFAGREVESQVRAKDVYHVTVEMAAGGTREVTVSDLNGLAVGARVHVNGDSLSFAN